jgi:hypothetical protein
VGLLCLQYLLHGGRMAATSAVLVVGESKRPEEQGMARAVGGRHAGHPVVVVRAVQVVHLHSGPRVAAAREVQVMRLRVGAVEQAVQVVLAQPSREGRTRAVRPLGEGSVAVRARMCVIVWEMGAGGALASHLEPAELL